jgi:hypothetical protein
MTKTKKLCVLCLLCVRKNREKTVRKENCALQFDAVDADGIGLEDELF